MLQRNRLATLIISVAFAFSELSWAQPPVVDASTPAAQNTPPGSVEAAGNSGGMNQSELFYQLQLLQQEVMTLRGVVEEQTHQLQQLKKQGMERYIDLDRRIGELATQSQTVVDTNKTSAVTNLPTRAVAAQEGEKAAYDAAYRLVTAKKFNQSLDAFKQFLVDYPGGKYAPNSYYWLGELYQVIQPKDLESSRQAFTQLLNQYPDHAKAPDAMYKLGKVYFLKGNKAKAREWLDKVIAQYGNGVSSAADKARRFMKENF